MAATAEHLATYEDLRKVPENRIAEIIDGRLEVQPRPAPKHALATSGLGMEIGPPFQGGRGGPGGWWILDEPELHLGDHVLVPDLAGWRKERLPVMPETAWFEVVPDWICEVLSPATAQRDRGAKRRIYADFGVAHLWLLDPDQRTLEAFGLREERWLLLDTFAGDDEVKAPPFAAVTFSLTGLWGG